MPKPSAHPKETAAAALDKICNTIATGRIAARELTSRVGSLGLRETHVRLLWFLSSTKLPINNAAQAPDQTELASGLGLSSAQISVVVDALRALGAVSNKPVAEDRRRQRWTLTPAGLELIERIVANLANSPAPKPSSANSDSTSTAEAA